MNSKQLGILWIVSVVFTWLMVTAIGAAIVSNFGAPEPPEGFFMNALLNPVTIMVALGVGSLATPCCYFYTRES